MFSSNSTLSIYVWRGNYYSILTASGGMTTQQTRYFTQENVRAYYLEYDSERARSFVLLEEISEDKLVVLDFDYSER